jgi:glycerol-3-phosphate dehydrogenase (NAD(P)+)
VRGIPYGELAEGAPTVRALMKLSRDTGVELPICRAVYDIVYRGKDPERALSELFIRSLKDEF